MAQLQSFDFKNMHPKHVVTFMLLFSMFFGAGVVFGNRDGGAGGSQRDDRRPFNQQGGGCQERVPYVNTTSCGSGYWSDWTRVGEEIVNGIRQEVQRRLYSGVRVTTRIQCGSQLRTLAGCQLSEMRRVPPGTGTGNPPGSGTTTPVGSTAGTGPSTGEGSFGSSGSGAGDADQAIIGNGNIRAVPSIVKSGERSKIIWATQGMVQCLIQGTNGDEWNLLSSRVDGENSRPITERTVYSLTCVDQGERVVRDSTVVNILPQVKEF